MQSFLAFWPVLVFIFGLWLGSIGLTVGLVLWITGQLAQQSASRIELKEVLLKEIRDTRHTLYGRIDMQCMALDEKVDDLVVRLAKVEVLVLNGHGKS